jgi:hypothetical protein
VSDWKFYHGGKIAPIAENAARHALDHWRIRSCDRGMSMLLFDQMWDEIDTLRARIAELEAENARLRIVPTDPNLRNAVAEVICNREFDAGENRWERTIRYADEGGGFSYSTLIRLMSTAHFVLEAVARVLEGRT